MAPQPLKLSVTSDIPTTAARFEKLEPFAFTGSAAVSAQATKGLRALESATIEGFADAASTLTFPDGFVQDLSVSTTIAKRSIPATGGFVADATGETPAITLEDLGKHEIRVNDLVLRLAPTLADGGLTGLDEFETECFLKPGQNNLLATITVPVGDSGAPTAPAGLNGTAAQTSATLSWSPSTDDIGVTGYDVFQDGVQVQSVTGTTASISGLTAGRDYKFKVRAKDASGKLSGFSQEITLTTTSTPSDAVSYDATGTAVLKTLTRGSFPVKGMVNAKFGAAGAFTADATFNTTSARLTTLGFLPLTAKIGILTSGAITGSITGQTLSAKALARIKVLEVRLFGAIPLAGGNNCQTKSLSVLNFASSAFTREQGGTASSTFAISDLNGCGVLNGLVSPLTAGTGNTISLKLTPKTTSAS